MLPMANIASCQCRGQRTKDRRRRMALRASQPPILCLLTSVFCPLTPPAGSAALVAAVVGPPRRGGRHLGGPPLTRNHSPLHPRQTTASLSAASRKPIPKRMTLQTEHVKPPSFTHRIHTEDAPVPHPFATLGQPCAESPRPAERTPTIPIRLARGRSRARRPKSSRLAPLFPSR